MNFNVWLLIAKRLCPPDQPPTEPWPGGCRSRLSSSDEMLLTQEPPRKDLRLVSNLPVLPGWLQPASPTGFARRHPLNYSRRALGVKRHLPAESMGSLWHRGSKTKKRRRALAPPWVSMFVAELLGHLWMH